MKPTSNSVQSERLFYFDQNSLCSDPIETKINSFLDLQSGWNYGEGDPINQDVLNNALRVYRLGKRNNLDCEAIALPNGNIEISLFRRDNDHFLIFLIKENMTIDFTYEIGIGHKYEKKETVNDIQFDEIRNKINGLAQPCNMSGSLAISTAKPGKDLLLIVSATTKERFLYFHRNVSQKFIPQPRASILKDFIQPNPVSTPLAIYR